MRIFKENILLFILFGLLAYPMFYYAYKFGTPEFGGLDVYSYYKLYTNWDFAHVDSPFNQRIISSFLIYLIHRTGVHYDTETSIAHLHLDQQVYFSAMLFNFICVILTSIILYRIVEKHLRADKFISFMAGAIFLMGFGTLTFLVSALSDALSTMFVALIFKCILDRSHVLHLLLVLSVFQREYILLVFGLLSLIYWFRYREERKFFMVTLLSSVICFSAYFICRKTIFFTPRYEHQIAISNFAHNIRVTLAAMNGYFRQTFMLQNLLIIYVLVFLYKKIKQLPVNSFHMLVTILMLMQIVVLSFVIGLGNNTGRYFYMVMPVIIYYLMVELHPIFSGRKSPEARII